MKMRHAIATLVGIMAITSSLTTFAANKMDIVANPAKVSKNGTTYVSLTIYDEKGKPLSDAKPFIKADPSYMVSVGNFVNCKSAEGMEQCGKMDQGLVGFYGAYVAEIKSKDMEGTVKIDAYLNKQVASTEITIGAGESVKTLAAATAITEVSTGNDMQAVKTGGSTKGYAFLIIGLFMLGAIAYSGKKSKA